MHGFQMGFVVPGAAVVPWSFVGYQNHTGTLGTITWPAGTQVGDSALFLLLTEAGGSPSMGGATQLRAPATMSSVGDIWAVWAVQSIASLAGPPTFSGLSGSGGACVAMTFRGMTLFTIKSAQDSTTAATMPLAGFTKDAACAQVLSCLVNRANSVPISLSGPGTLLFKYAPTVYWVAAASSQTPASYTNGANLTWLNYDLTWGASGVAIECTSGSTPTIPSCSIVPAIADITPTELETISSDNGTWAGYPYPSFTYQWWTVSPNAAISGATNSTYALTGTDIGTSLYCKVTGTNASGSATAQSNTVGPVATAAPVNTVLPAISGSTVVGSTLTSTTGTWTGQPTITYAYQWKRGVTNVGTNQNTYVPVAGDVGSTITCQVTATNAGGSTSATSAATGTITQPVPVISVAPVVSGSLTQGSVLSCTTGTWTNSPSSYAYQWYQSPSTAISGATSSTYTTVVGDVGLSILCKVTATNAGGSSSPADSNTVGPVTALPVPVISVAPVVSGSLTQGSVLSCTTGTWTNSPSSYAYQWYQSPSTAISGATTNTYTTVVGDVGLSILCKVTATNTGGASSPASSNTVGPVTAAAPLLDKLSATATVAYSTRKLRAAYGGAALRVRRSSDNAEQDIGFSGSDLDTSALTTFCGSGSGFIRKWYNQAAAGGSDLASLGDTTREPRIVNAGALDTLNSKAAPWWTSGWPGTFLSVDISDLAQPDTLCMAVKQLTPTGAGHLVDGGAARQLVTMDGPVYRIYAGATILTGGTVDTYTHGLIAVFNGASSVLYVENVSTITGNPGSSALDVIYLGAGQDGTAFGGWYGEFIAFNSALGSTDRATLTDDWFNYWIVSPASMSGLRAWYKADAGVTTSSGNITAVADQSGNGFNLTQGGGNIPFSATGLNGKPCFDFVAANEGFLSCSTFAFPAADSSVSVFAVVNINSNSEGDSGIVLFVGSGQTDDWNNTSSLAFLVRQGANNIQSFANTSELSLSTGGLTADTNYRMGLTWNASSNVGQHYVNNTAGTSDSATALALNASAGKLLIGARQYGGSGVPSHADDFDGQIAEIVIFSGVLSTTEREQLDTYFRWKWGL